MRVYLQIKSRNSVGYIPDTIRLLYKENGEHCVLRLGIINGKASCVCNRDNGIIDFDIKCDLEPISIKKGEEQSKRKKSDLKEVSSPDYILDCFENAEVISMGFKPFFSNEISENDKISCGQGKIELDCNSTVREVNFEFKPRKLKY